MRHESSCRLVRVQLSRFWPLAHRAGELATSSLLAVDDLREVMGKRELYRRFSRISEVLVACAERVWYAHVKEA